MTPRSMARDAIRVVDRVERETIARLHHMLRVVERDAIARSRLLSALPEGTRRAIIQLRVQEALVGSTAARDLLSLGSSGGPLAEDFRRGIQASYADGLRSANRAAVAAGIDAKYGVGTVDALMAFGTRVDVQLLEAMQRTTLTTLGHVGTRAMQRLEDALVAGAVRGAGPRAAARLVRESVSLTRYEAERIARTVYMRTNNDARSDVYRQLGVEYVQHNATNDERTCSYCEARHGMVYEMKNAEDPTLHPHCRCVLTPWSESMRNRGDEYFERTRAEMAARRESEDRESVSATARAPFERMDGRSPPSPVWAPSRGWL